MSKSDRDGRGFRHHKACPSLNCDQCVNGKAKAPARRAQRREGKAITFAEWRKASQSVDPESIRSLPASFKF